MTTGKTIALTRRTFVGKIMSLLFNMLSRLVIVFLPRSKHLLISWLQSPFAVILEPRKIKSATVSTVSPPICHEVMGPDAVVFVASVTVCGPSSDVCIHLCVLKMMRPHRYHHSQSQTELTGVFSLEICNSLC